MKVYTIIRDLVIFFSYPFFAFLDSLISNYIIGKYDFIYEGNFFINKIGFFSVTHIFFLAIASFNILLTWLYLRYWKNILPSLLSKITDHFPLYMSAFHLIAIIYNLTLILRLYNPPIKLYIILNSI